MSRGNRIRILDTQIEQFEYAARASYSNKLTRQHKDKVRALKAERQRLLLRSTNPFEVVWCWLRSHPILAIILALSPVMIMGGPTAVAGFFMIVMTVSVLWFLLRSLFRHWGFATKGPKGTSLPNFTEFAVPGGLIRVRGQLSEEEAESLRKRFELGKNRLHRTAVLGSGVEFQPDALPDPKLAPVMPESVSALHAGRPDVAEPLHPELPAWMRQTWNKAIAEYRTRVYVEGTKYRDLKEQFSELYRSVLDRDSMIDWTRRLVEPSHSSEPVDVSALQRIERGLEAISPEGARYGELLFRAQRGEDIRKYATEDGEVVMLGQKAVASPEMPRDFVPILDRDFELTTDCRYHHVADHAIVEQSVSDGHVLRCCTVCESPTYWLERA
jgi:hypothetical protein